MSEEHEYDIIPIKHVTNYKHSVLRNKSVGKEGNKSTTPEIVTFVRTP